MPNNQTERDEADLEHDLRELDTLEGRLFAHRYASVAIQFAGETQDPPAGAAGRGEALAALDWEAHELLCAPETGALLDRLADELGPDASALPETDPLGPARVAQLRVLARDRADETNVPADVAADFTRLANEAQDVWVRAKRSSDWDAFAPYLDRLVASMRTIAALRAPGADPYDAWLDYFEHGTSRAFYDRFFDEVKACVVPLVAAVRERGWQPSRACLEGRFAHDGQLELSRRLMALEGVRADAIVLAETEHPFSDAVTSQHAYIATHIHEDDLASNVFSMLHEGGHAMYEQNVDAAFDFTSLKGGVSMGVHESQSRFFENYVGRSQAFAPVLLGLLREQWPGRFDGTTARDLWLAVNRAEPSLVRTEADELTYPLHVIIRYELEQLLMSGEAKAADVPALWNERYRSYLGVEVPDDARGCLQDVHWAGGMIGYFPTYALGSAYGAQFLDAMRSGGLDFDAVVASGDLAPIRAWLRERVWRFGRGKEPADIVRDACGTPFDASHYTSYLARKFGEIYGL